MWMGKKKKNRTTKAMYGGNKIIQNPTQSQGNKERNKQTTNNKGLVYTI